jgi:hypothetical protein
MARRDGPNEFKIGDTVYRMWEDQCQSGTVTRDRRGGFIRVQWQDGDKTAELALDTPRTPEAAFRKAALSLLYAYHYRLAKGGEANLWDCIERLLKHARALADAERARQPFDPIYLGC